MSNIVEIVLLIAAVSLIIMVVLLIPILLDLRRIVKNWKKFSDIVEVGISPIVWGASFLVEIFKKLVEVGEEKSKEE